MGKWFCIWDDLPNPKTGLNLISNHCSEGTLVISTLIYIIIGISKVNNFTKIKKVR
jgi:uncharacterized membrane protein YuzA (DUF378 family)